MYYTISFINSIYVTSIPLYIQSTLESFLIPLLSQFRFPEASSVLVYFSTVINFTYSKMSCKWNHSVCILLGNTNLLKIMFFRFIHIVVWVSCLFLLFLSSTPLNTNLFIHFLLMNSWTLSSFGLGDKIPMLFLYKIFTFIHSKEYIVVSHHDFNFHFSDVS